jgi:dCTP deaminase
VIVPSQEIRKRRIFTPFAERTVAFGLTYGLGPAGYDVRLGRDLKIEAGFTSLGVLLEHIAMPEDLLGVVHDKSTHARCGIQVQNTIIEPGWRGILAIEITYAPRQDVAQPAKFRTLERGTPIAQIVLHQLSMTTDRPYAGKYQDSTADDPGPKFD